MRYLEPEGKLDLGGADDETRLSNINLNDVPLKKVLHVFCIWVGGHHDVYSCTLYLSIQFYLRLP